MTLPSHRQCVSAVIFRPDGSFLLVHKPRKNDSWQIPQGGIEEGESKEETASRELMEETSISVDPASFTLCSQTYQYDFPEGFMRAEKPKYKGQILYFLTAKVPQETEVQVDNRELDEFKWITVNELGNFLKRQKYREVVKSIVSLLQ